jgi:hypothetical protein
LLNQGALWAANANLELVERLCAKPRPAAYPNLIGLIHAKPLCCPVASRALDMVLWQLLAFLIHAKLLLIFAKLSSSIPLGS